MPPDLSAPDTDDEVARAKFYTSVAQTLNSVASGQERSFKILEKLEGAVSKQQEFQQKLIFGASIIGVIWVGASGIAGWYAQRLVAQAELQVSRIEALEKAAVVKDIQSKMYEGVPEKLDAIKNRMNHIEDEVEMLVRKGNQK